MTKVFMPVTKKYSFILAIPTQKHKVFLDELVKLIKAANPSVVTDPMVRNVKKA